MRINNGEVQEGGAEGRKERRGNLSDLHSHPSYPPASSPSVYSSMWWLVRSLYR